MVDETLDGFPSGPDATVRATADAVARAASARAVVLVEGISDQVALETLAECRQRDLEAEAIVIVPMGGAHAISRFLKRFGPDGAGLPLAGLCDAAEEPDFRRGLTQAAMGSPTTRSDMESLGFFVCRDDLEQELIRAAGRTAIEDLLDSQGDLGSFRTLQKQSTWRDKPFDEQMHRWLRAGARRNLRYARLLVQALSADQVPRPLLGVLDSVA